MYLGNTIEEKSESMALLNRGAKKLAIAFAVIGAFATIMMVAMVASVEVDPPSAKITLIAIMLTYPIAFYWMGKFWYYGFVTIKGWMTKADVSGGEVLASSASVVTVSYLLGGRRGARMSGIILLVVLAVTLMFGFYVGLFSYFKVRKEIKKAYTKEAVQ